MEKNNTNKLTRNEIFWVMDSIEVKKNEYHKVLEHFVRYRFEAVENDTRNHLSEQINNLEIKIKTLNKIYRLLLSETI